MGEVTERAREGGKKVFIVEVEEEEDRKDLLERELEIKRNWSVGADEDLTMEERKLRWRILEKAREERRKGRSAVVNNRQLWIDGKEWKWNEERKIWWERGGD